MGFPVCRVCLVLVLLLAHCGVSATVDSVKRLYSCGYANNCKGFTTAMAWCRDMAVPVSSTKQLNITSAQISDSGVYHCCSVSDCCNAAAQSVNLLDSTLNVTVYAHAIVSSANATCSNQNPCVVSYDTTQDRVTISNKIGHYPSNTAEANRQGIQYGVWSVVNRAQVTNIIYRCRNFSCESVTTRNDIGSLTFMGEFGQNATIEDLDRLNSNLTLVYSIDTVSISSSRCTYTAQTAVTYTFEGTTPTLSPSAFSSPPNNSLMASTPSVTGIGGIAGIAASIVVVLLIVTILLVGTAVMCYCRGNHPIRSKSQYPVESPRDVDSGITVNQSPEDHVYDSVYIYCQPHTTVVTSTSSGTIDSGNDSGSGMHLDDDCVPWEDPYILSVYEDQTEPTTPTAAKGVDSVSLVSNDLPDIDKATSERV